MHIALRYQADELIGFANEGIQAGKRKEKQRYPVTVFALLQRETDTRTSSHISSEVLESRQTKTRQKPRMIGPLLPRNLQASQRRTSHLGYYPSHSTLHPPRTPFKRFIPPWIWKGVGLELRVKEGARSPNPKISLKTFSFTTHNSN